MQLAATQAHPPRRAALLAAFVGTLATRQGSIEGANLSVSESN
jgi:hypothetical protein